MNLNVHIFDRICVCLGKAFYWRVTHVALAMAFKSCIRIEVHWMVSFETWGLGRPDTVSLGLVKVSVHLMQRTKVSVFMIFMNLHPGWVCRYLFGICDTLKWIRWRNFLKLQQSMASLTSQVPPQKYPRDFGCWWLLSDFPLLSTWSTTLTVNGKPHPLPPQSRLTPSLSLTSHW